MPTTMEQARLLIFSNIFKKSHAIHLGSAFQHPYYYGHGGFYGHPFYGYGEYHPYYGYYGK